MCGTAAEHALAEPGRTSTTARLWLCGSPRRAERESPAERAQRQSGTRRKREKQRCRFQPSRLPGQAIR